MGGLDGGCENCILQCGDGHGEGRSNLDGEATAFLGGKAAGGSSHAVHAGNSTLFAPRHRTINWHGVFQPACLGAALSTLAAKDQPCVWCLQASSGGACVH